MGTRIKGQKNQKFTIDEIHNFCKLYDIEFIGDEYINNNHLHTWFCKKHNKNQIQSLDKIKRSGGLKCCGRERLISGSKRIIKELGQLLNVTLVSEYYSNHQLLTWRCNMHDKEFTRSLQTIKKLLKPPCCQYEDKMNIIEEIIKPLGYELLDDEYVGSTHTWYCAHHDKIHYNKRTTYQNFKNGQLLKCCAAEKIKGKNHPNYNVNISDEQRIKNRRTIEYKNWRQLVIKRDNLTCQYCGAKDTKIVAHHLDNYLTFASLRYKLNNGITLCVSCHIKFHSLYGKGNTTKEQYDEYVATYSSEPLSSEPPES